MINQKDINRKLEQFRKAGERESLKPQQIISVGGLKSYNGIRWAACKTDAGEHQIIKCDMRGTNGDFTGEEVDVYCTIPGNGDLNQAIPFLREGTDIPIIQKMTITENGPELLWTCLWGFQKTNICEGS